MKKSQELTDASSCLSRARDDEMLFVLLGRDPAASAAIGAWMDERVRLGKNQPGDAQLEEARACALSMPAPSYGPFPLKRHVAGLRERVRLQAAIRARDGVTPPPWMVQLAAALSVAIREMETETETETRE